MKMTFSFATTVQVLGPKAAIDKSSPSCLLDTSTMLHDALLVPPHAKATHPSTYYYYVASIS